MDRLFDRITKASLGLRWVTIVLTAAFLALGVWALTQLNQELMPSMEFPIHVVLAQWPGSDAESMADEVAVPIEQTLMDMERVLGVETVVSPGFAYVAVRSDFGVDMDDTEANIRDRLAGLRFPEDVQDPDIITFDLNTLPVLVASASADNIPLEELKALVEQKVVPAIEALDGVAAVQIHGGQEIPPDILAEKKAELAMMRGESAPASSEVPTGAPTPRPTASVAPTAEPDVPAPTPAVPSAIVPATLPASWRDLIPPEAKSLGLTINTTADLTPFVIQSAIEAAPEALDELTAEMLLGCGPAILAELPEEFLDGLDTALAAELAARIEAMPEPPPLPMAMVAASAALGVPLRTAADLNALAVNEVAASTIGAFVGQLPADAYVWLIENAPGFLDALDAPTVLPLLPAETLARFPQAYLEGLEPELAASLLAKLEGTQPAGEAGAAQGELPPSWQALFAASPAPITRPQELDAAGLAYVAYEYPELMADLEPDHLLALTPDALRALPADYVSTLDAALVTELAGHALQGGTELSSLPVAPPAPSGWVATWEQFGMTLKTVAGFRPQSINMMAQTMPGLINELTPEALAWQMAAHPDFLDQLDPGPRETIEQIMQGGWVPLTTINRTNGAASLGLSIAKTQAANTVRTSHAITDRLEQLGEELGIQFDYAFEQASFIEESISGVAREGALGALFAILVILLFLSGMAHGRYKLSWRSTLVTAVSIPTSVLMGFAFLYLSKNSLNIMTLSGMTVAVGRVVDDSIVVLENIYRHIQRGEDRRRAVIDGTREVSVAIFASTVTTVAVFLPIGLVGGLIGQIFLPFGLTVTFALASSFLVAITIIPLLAYLFIRQEHLPPEGETWLQKVYTPLLRWAIRPEPWVQTPVVRWFLNNRFIVLAIATLLFLASLAVMAGLPQTFLPNVGEPQVTTSIRLDESDLVLTDLRVQELEARLHELDGVTVIQTLVGGGGGFATMFGGGGVDGGTAEITVTASSAKVLDQLTDQIRAAAESVFSPDEVNVSSADLMTQGMGGFEMILVADDFSALSAVHDQVVAELKGVDGLANVTSNLAMDSEGRAVQITRVDGQRALSFSADVETQDALGVQRSAQAHVESLDLPAGIRVEQGFATQQQTQGFRDLFRATGISVAVVYLVMVLTFAALLPPFNILFSLPFAVVGAAIALALRNQTLGMSSMVGLVMLVGIVVTNAIVLIDLVQHLRRQGQDTYTALLEAGRTRLRPIWMTALAAVLALIPLAAGLNEGAIVAAELATAVIGGLLVSTFLTLLVVPVVYSLTDSAVARLGQILPGRLCHLVVRIAMGRGAANNRNDP